jgi:hypothetical protein
VAAGTLAGRSADGQQLAPETQAERQRLCLRLRGAEPAFHFFADAEHAVSSLRCNRSASGCGGSTPPVRTSIVGNERRSHGHDIWAPLAEIRMSDRTVRRLSAATVERYRLWLEQGREAPPVRLARTGEGFAIRDGRHRIAAALAAGHTLIEAEVRPIARLVWRLLHPRETLSPPSLGTRP